MNQTFIDLFNLKRSKDLNVCCALSNVEKKVTAYIDHYFSPINTLKKNYSNFAEKNISFRTHKKTLDYLNTNGYNFIKELGPNGIFKLI